MDRKTTDAHEVPNTHYSLCDALELQIPHDKTHFFFLNQKLQYGQMQSRHQNSLDIHDVREVLSSHES